MVKNDMEILNEGSSKNTLGVKSKKATSTQQGVGGFDFQDFFSVFDGGLQIFGDMPIKKKAKKMAVIADTSFNLLKNACIPTHYNSFDGDTYIDVDLAQVIKPGIDISIEPGTRNYVVPLEIIFRDYLHPNASLLKDIQEAGENTDSKYHYSKYGLTQMPVGGERLDKTAINYTTKFEEPTDRDLTRDEAIKLSGLSEEEMITAEKLVTDACKVISDYAEQCGLIHTDGKIELIKDANGTLRIGDVVGTPDEDRFLAKVNKDPITSYVNKYVQEIEKQITDMGMTSSSELFEKFKNIGKTEDDIYVDISKEYVRNWFEDEGWKAKAIIAKETYKTSWRDNVDEAPDMDKYTMDLISRMYSEFACAWKTGTKYSEELAAELYVAEQIHKIDIEHSKFMES